MKIVCLDARIFEEILSKMENLALKFSKFKNVNESNPLNNWMDGQDVCLFLCIKPRTLQTLRDNGTLAYTQISKKIYYCPEDVKSIVKLVENNKVKKQY